jgi:hypothetical protein
MEKRFCEYLHRSEQTIYLVATENETSRAPLKVLEAPAETYTRSPKIITQHPTLHTINQNYLPNLASLVNREHKTHAWDHTPPTRHS